MGPKDLQLHQESYLGTKLCGETIQVFFKEKGSARLPRISRGDGIFFWDTDGHRYIDVSSGPVTNNLGSGNKTVLSAMEIQAKAAAFAFPGQFESEANERLSNLLTSLAGPGFERASCVWRERSGGKFHKVRSAICAYKK